jgi:bifunctional DNA-binding transcriptional regulator/antitoxin component of YhaV-PrlF toxin-antitoxin module
VIKFNTTILKFARQGEKTGWSYIEISANRANQLKPGQKVSYRVKGKLDNVLIKQVSLIPMGKGAFIIPVNARIRKALGKKAGDKLAVQLEVDETKFVLSPDLMACLKEEPESLKFFKSLPGSHQKYFSGWIEGAKTSPTKAKRIAMAINAFSRSMGFPEMMREYKASRG